MSATVMTPELVGKLPSALRKLLRQQCDGEWDRVTVESNEYTVHNNATMARKAASSTPIAAPLSPSPVAETPPPPPPKPAKATPPPAASRRHKRAEAAALQEMFGSGARPQEPVGAVHVDHSEPVERAKPPTPEWTFDPDSCDWTLVDFDKPITDLRETVKNGLPEHVPYQIHPDVLAMSGVDLGMFESAIRAPHRVIIRPETRSKRYPVFAFHRGDISSIVGFRTPNNPMLIAIYVDPMLEADTYRPGSTAGGGAKRKVGLPTTVRAMLRAIANLGVEVGYDTADARTGEVTYKGQSLGKVTVHNSAPRQTVESDYQRIVRKVHAIDQRS